MKPIPPTKSRVAAMDSSRSTADYTAHRKKEWAFFTIDENKQLVIESDDDNAEYDSPPKKGEIKFKYDTEIKKIKILGISDCPDAGITIAIVKEILWGLKKQNFDVSQCDVYLSNKEIFLKNLTGVKLPSEIKTELKKLLARLDGTLLTKVKKSAETWLGSWSFSSWFNSASSMQDFILNDQALIAMIESIASGAYDKKTNTFNFTIKQIDSLYQFLGSNYPAVQVEMLTIQDVFSFLYVMLLNNQNYAAIIRSALNDPSKKIMTIENSASFSLLGNTETNRKTVAEFFNFYVTREIKWLEKILKPSAYSDYQKNKKHPITELGIETQYYERYEKIMDSPLFRQPEENNDFTLENVPLSVQKSGYLHIAAMTLKNPDLSSLCTTIRGGRSAMKGQAIVSDFGKVKLASMIQDDNIASEANINACLKKLEDNHIKCVFALGHPEDHQAFSPDTFMSKGRVQADFANYFGSRTCSNNKDWEKKSEGVYLFKSAQYQAESTYLGKTEEIDSYHLKILNVNTQQQWFVRVHHYSVDDYMAFVFNKEEIDLLLDNVLGFPNQILIHCRGGNGRTGTLAFALANVVGIPLPDDDIEAIKEVRKKRYLIQHPDQLTAARIMQEEIRQAMIIKLGKLQREYPSMESTANNEINAANFRMSGSPIHTNPVSLPSNETPGFESQEYRF